MPELKTVINGCRQGNRLAQKQLYKVLYSYAMGLCMRYAQNTEEAEEMLNNGFFKVFKKIDQYDVNLPFKPWFKVVMVHTAIDYQKAKKVFYTEEISEVQLDLVNDHGIETQMAYEELILVIQKLSPAYRIVFNMHEIEGYKHHEIAEQLNISTGTSKSNLAKAKKKLRTLLQEKQLTKLN